jgi:hypothetical protein
MNLIEMLKTLEGKTISTVETVYAMPENHNPNQADWIVFSFTDGTAISICDVDGGAISAEVVG